MKRIQSKSLAMALLRGAVVLGGLMATACFTLFTESWDSLFAVALIGITATILFDECLKRLSHAE